MNGRDVMERGKIDANSVISGRNYDILDFFIIAKLLTSRQFPELSRYAFLVPVHCKIEDKPISVWWNKPFLAM